MAKFSRFLPASAIVAGLALSSFAVMAQDQSARPPAAGARDHGGKDGHWGDHHGPMASQLVEARIAYIKTALRITPAQTAQFNAVADLMRKEAKERDARMAEWQNHKPDDHARPDPLQMLEHRQKMMQDGAARLGEMIAAWKPLYASLDDSQKQLLPAVLGHQGHHGWGHGEHW
jgi:hypothetical protein